jgi:hypothetical protein
MTTQLVLGSAGRFVGESYRTECGDRRQKTKDTRVEGEAMKAAEKVDKTRIPKRPNDFAKRVVKRRPLPWRGCLFMPRSFKETGRVYLGR